MGRAQPRLSRRAASLAQDAARVESGELPEIRKIRIGGLQAPYWEAGAAFLPYGQGYFASAVLESGYRAQQQGGGRCVRYRDGDQGSARQ